MALRNRFGWSISRESMFETCRRRYYFHYYLSWNGWNARAPAIAREAFKLKRLVSLPLWRGQLVHYIASKVLQSMKRKGRIPERHDVLRYMDERFEHQLAFSAGRHYLTEPKKSGGIPRHAANYVHGRHSPLRQATAFHFQVLMWVDG